MYMKDFMSLDAFQKVKLTMINVPLFRHEMMYVSNEKRYMICYNAMIRSDMIWYSITHYNNVIFTTASSIADTISIPLHLKQHNQNQ